MRDLTNLWDETVRAIGKNGKGMNDVNFVGVENGSVAWSEFLNLAKDFNYYAGFGGQEVRADLVIVFHDGSWLSRSEYDGSEWWKYNKAPALQPEIKINTLSQRALEDENCEEEE